MAISSIADQLAKITAAGLEKQDKVVKSTLFDLSNEIVISSPVDEGIFINNWIGAYQLDISTTNQKGKTGAAALGRIKRVIGGLPDGGSFWMTNSLPYADRLENGWSQQAPSGMIKTAVSHLDAIVDRNIKKYK